MFLENSLDKTYRRTKKDQNDFPLLAMMFLVLYWNNSILFTNTQIVLGVL